MSWDWPAASMRCSRGLSVDRWRSVSRPSRARWVDRYRGLRSLIPSALRSDIEIGVQSGSAYRSGVAVHPTAVPRRLQRQSRKDADYIGHYRLAAQIQGKLFSVSEVAKGKPFPDLFLYAAGKFGVAPAACTVIEDTRTGVAAGVAAGMTVYGYCAHTPAHRLLEAGAYCTFDGMSALPGLLCDARQSHPA